MFLDSSSHVSSGSLSLALWFKGCVSKVQSDMMESDMKCIV